MLPVANRLKQSADFRRVYTHGSSCAVGPIVLYSLKSGGAIRIGFSVSRKLGNAVKRNRIRRLLREVASGILKCIAPEHDFVVIARKSAAESTFADLEQAMFEALRRKGVLKSDITSSAENGSFSN